MLFQHGLFFRCSYIPGDIPMTDTKTDENGRYIEDGPPRFRSFTLSESAPAAYQRESTFKGVGCTIAHGAGIADLSQTVGSFYLKTDNNRIIAHDYRDFRFSAYELAVNQDVDADGNLVEPNYPASTETMLIAKQQDTSTSSQSGKKTR